MTRRILIAGESWTTHSIHQKGFDSFTTTEYNEGVGWLRAALEANGWSVDYMPAHVASRNFPATVDALNAYLLGAYAQGLRVVLIIDEAQNLSLEALEQVRLLTNLETDTQKLLQIILLGQPELRVMLARPDMRQLSQRITARFHLTP